MTFGDTTVIGSKSFTLNTPHALHAVEGLLHKRDGRLNATTDPLVRPAAETDLHAITPMDPHRSPSAPWSVVGVIWTILTCHWRLFQDLGTAHPSSTRGQEIEPWSLGPGVAPAGGKVGADSDSIHVNNCVAVSANS